MRAKKHGGIPAIAPLIQKLLENGFRIDEKTLHYVLDWASEKLC